MNENKCRLKIHKQQWQESKTKSETLWYENEKR